MATESAIDSITVMFAISGFFGLALLVSSIIAIKGRKSKVSEKDYTKSN